MKKQDFEVLQESLQQAIDYTHGNKKSARVTIRTIEIPEFDSEDIVALRDQLHLTQHGLANVVGVSPRTVEAWEAGVNRPNGSARHLLYLLGKSPDVLPLLVV